MINLNSLLRYKEIENLGYDTVYVEKPVADLVDFDWKNILDEPPENNSKETLSELKLISKETLNRTNEDIRLVKIIDQDPDKLFIEITNQYDLEYPQAKIEEFYFLIKPIILNIKSLWNRPRPAQLAKYFNIPIDVIVTDTHHTAAYPSGHTVYSKLVSLVIKDTYPQISYGKLNKIVDQTAKARIMQGVHYPSDNRASLQLMQVLFDKLQPRLNYYER
jgi:hypothetical protein